MEAWQPEPLSIFETPEWVKVVGVFDLETTGVDVTRDRIVTAHVGLLGADGTVVSARDWFADPGIAIPEGATAVHGITTARARAEGRPAVEVVAEVVAALRGLLDAGIPIVAYNAPYDFSLLKHEALRHGLAPIVDPSPVIDPLVVDKAYDRYRRGKRTLQVVAAHYAVRLDGSTARTTRQPTPSPLGGWRRPSRSGSRRGCRRPWASCTRGRSRGRARRRRA